MEEVWPAVVGIDFVEAEVGRMVALAFLMVGRLGWALGALELRGVGCMAGTGSEGGRAEDSLLCSGIGYRCIVRHCALRIFCNNKRSTLDNKGKHRKLGRTRRKIGSILAMHTCTRPSHSHCCSSILYHKMSIGLHHCILSSWGYRKGICLCSDNMCHNRFGTLLWSYIPDN